LGIAVSCILSMWPIDSQRLCYSLSEVLNRVLMELNKRIRGCMVFNWRVKKKSM
jgi:hypothetical protein